MWHMASFSGMALLGCDVVSTDQTEVLPLLMRNVERNTSRIMQMNPDSGIMLSFWYVKMNPDSDEYRGFG